MGVEARLGWERGSFCVLRLGLGTPRIQRLPMFVRDSTVR